MCCTLGGSGLARSKSNYMMQHLRADFEVPDHLHLCTTSPVHQNVFHCLPQDLITITVRPLLTTPQLSVSLTLSIIFSPTSKEIPSYPIQWKSVQLKEV